MVMEMAMDVEQMEGTVAMAFLVVMALLPQDQAMELRPHQATELHLRHRQLRPMVLLLLLPQFPLQCPLLRVMALHQLPLPQLLPPYLVMVRRQRDHRRQLLLQPQVTAHLPHCPRRHLQLHLPHQVMGLLQPHRLRQVTVHRPL